MVGIVYEVSDNYSKAISLLDTKSSVSFKLLKDSNLKGVITQNSTLDDKENYKTKVTCMDICLIVRITYYLVM